MNRTQTQSVLDVLRFERSERDLTGALSRMNEKQWRTSLDWLDAGGLSLYFWQQIRQRGLWSALPLSICSQLEKRRARNIERTRAMVREWKSLNNLFASSGVHCVALKGFAAVPDYCPDPALRVQFDHDWMIESDSLGRAEELLRAAGYSRKEIRERDRAVYVPNTCAGRGAWHPLQAYAAELPRPVELHLKLWDSAEEKVAIEFPEDCMARSVTRDWEGQVIATLSDADALLFEAMHAFRHIIHNWCRLSVLYEIACFLHRRREDLAFWQTLLCRIERNFPLQQALKVVLSLAAHLFGPADYLAFPPAGARFPNPSVQLWVDRYGTKSALSNFSKDKSSLFLLREFVTDHSSWRAIQRRRLFPIQMLPRHRAEKGKAELSAPGSSKLKRIRRLRRVGFHLRTAFLYALEFPQWRYLTWREEKRRRAHQRLSSTAERVANSLCQCSEPAIEPTGMQFRSIKRD